MWTLGVTGGSHVFFAFIIKFIEKIRSLYRTGTPYHVETILHFVNMMFYCHNPGSLPVQIDKHHDQSYILQRLFLLKMTRDVREPCCEMKNFRVPGVIGPTTSFLFF